MEQALRGKAQELAEEWVIDGARGLGWGRGYGCGCGGGFFGRMFYTKDERAELLKDREAMLEGELKAVREELADKTDQK